MLLHQKDAFDLPEDEAGDETVSELEPTSSVGIGDCWQGLEIGLDTDEAEEYDIGTRSKGEDSVWPWYLLEWSCVGVIMGKSCIAYEVIKAGVPRWRKFISYNKNHWSSLYNSIWSLNMHGWAKSLNCLLYWYIVVDVNEVIWCLIYMANVINPEPQPQTIDTYNFISMRLKH